MGRPRKKCEIPLTKNQQDLVSNNLGLAYGESQRTVKLRLASRLSMDETDSAALFGLVKAAQGYNPKRKCEKTGKPFAFSTYAVRTIRNQLMTSNAESGLIHLGRSICTCLWRRDQGKPYETKDEYLDKAAQSIKTCTLPFGVGDTEHLAARSIARHDDQIEEKDRAEWICQEVCHAIDQLPPRVAEAIRQYYFHGGTFKEVAVELGVSPERIRQLVIMGRKKLSESLKHMKAKL